MCDGFMKGMVGQSPQAQVRAAADAAEGCVPTER